MSDPTADEIDDLVSQLDDDLDASDGLDAPDEEPTPAKKPRRRTSRKTAKSSPADVDDDDVSGMTARTIEEMDVAELLPKGLPKPTENIKSLSDLYARYGVGQNPDFRIHIYRTYPKFAPGNRKFDGFYDSWDTPMTEEAIQAEYGGGQYRVVIVGPHPQNPQLMKPYSSMQVGLAGDPIWDRLPRALQHATHAESKSDAAAGNPPPMAFQPAQENPKLAEAAMKMASEMADRERQERHRMEERRDTGDQKLSSMMTPVIEAERRRADDVLRAERERSEAERGYMNERLREAKEQFEETRRRMETEVKSRPSLGDELRSLREAGIMGGDNGAAKEMFTQILEKHRGEMDGIQRQHQSFIESLRSGHQAEVQALRDAHAREMVAEREASKSREQRIEERLAAEREERKRDQDRYRQQIEDRDQQWKDRMESAKMTYESSWESKHSSMVSNYESRIQWMQGETDRLKSELLEARMRHEEKGDIMTQLMKMKEFQTVITEFGGGSKEASSGGGGIGISAASGEDWKSVAAEQFGERLPQILQVVGGLLTGNNAAAAIPPQQQQQFQEGQIVPTPQGEMVVVRDPASNQLALAPRAEVEKHMRAQAQGAPGLLTGGAPQRRASGRRGDAQRQRSRSADYSAVPNLAEGLPKRRPPWEGGGDEVRHAAPEPPPAPPPMPRMTTRSAAASEEGEPMEMSHMERQGIKMIAKMVHESVMSAEEPEDFVARAMNSYDPDVLQTLVGGYTTEQIVRGILQVEPKSGGATPGGQQFVREAFAQLRDALRK